MDRNIKSKSDCDVQQIKLGDKVSDKVTGYQGTVIAITYYLYASKSFGVRGPLDKDGKIPDAYWFEEGSLEITEQQK